MIFVTQPVAAAWRGAVQPVADRVRRPQGQEIADTDRAAVEKVLGKYLHVDPQSAAFISLPAFPLGVDPVRLQRVVSSMMRFGLLPKNTNLQITSMITG